MFAAMTGHRSLIKNMETGFIFELDDDQKMMDSIILLYKNPALRREIGIRNENEAKKYSVDIAVNKMAQIYNECI